MNKFDDYFKKADKSFKKKYQTEINKLKNISKEELATIIPDITNKDELRQRLIDVVQEASEKNFSQAALLEHISKLGKNASNLFKRLFKFDG